VKEVADDGTKTQEAPTEEPAKEVADEETKTQDVSEQPKQQRRESCSMSPADPSQDSVNEETKDSLQDEPAEEKRRRKKKLRRNHQHPSNGNDEVLPGVSPRQTQPSVLRPKKKRTSSHRHPINY
jgi:hypothetical protein